MQKIATRSCPSFGVHGAAACVSDSVQITAEPGGQS